MICENCDGQGTVKNDCAYCCGDATEECGTCGGSGEVGTEDDPETCEDCDGDGCWDCSECDGTGYEEDDCDECHGSGEVPDDDEDSK